jgi:hypothetical protein
MIKARFLRLGNFAKDIQGNIVTVARIARYEIGIEENNDKYNPSDLTGIELTEENLTKALNFEKDDYGKVHQLVKEPFTVMPFIISGELKGWTCLFTLTVEKDGKEEKKSQGLRQIKYVHELQNLWNSLTDKETFINKTYL